MRAKVSASSAKLARKKSTIGLILSTPVPHYWNPDRFPVPHHQGMKRRQRHGSCHRLQDRIEVQDKQIFVTLKIHPLA
jgi:hypothetical protein